MKTILYFTDTPGFGPWKILISSRASGDLRTTCRSDSKSFKIVIKKIRELSNGYFSDDNHEFLKGSGVGVSIFRAKLTGDLRLIYHIDCISDGDTWQQVIRIFGIYTLNKMDHRLWNSVSYQLATRSKDHISRCTAREYSSGARGRVVLPVSFPLTQETGPRSRSITPTIPKEHLDEVTSVVMDKFFTMSQELLRSIFVDLDVTHVFEVSPTEAEIIAHTSSCFVLGRSGTGKTTAMIFKMLGIERIWRLNPELTPKPRQLFVTRSRVLATKVNEYFTMLSESLALQGASLAELSDIAKERDEVRQRRELIDLDDVQDWRSDLPARFSLLEDEHFPLFLTFDNLCEMVEADIVFSRGGRQLDQDAADQRHNNPSLITYDRFLKECWPHLPKPSKKGFEPSLVFSEFIGVIKGSEETLATPEHLLDKNSYIKFSHRSQSTFSGQRDVLYVLFERYRKWKKSRGGFDPADRAHKLLDWVSKTGIQDNQLDFLYVDEVQDNILIDILLLRSLCQNPDGMFWAGDTAQTIAVGSAFNFDALRAMLYRVEQKYQQSDNVLPPPFFKLVTNYRSHGGIVRCAQSVIALITQFFPDSIDALSEEEGLVDGVKPIFFTGDEYDQTEYEDFLSNDQCWDGAAIEFGAKQCILVRDDSARDKLRKKVGDVGIIMTLYDSKGLEYDDVLLWNFFRDSPLNASQFRVLLNALEGESKISVPTFDKNKYASMCSELKFLYVAVTRARKNLWIVDSSKNAEPLKAIWTSRNLIHICTQREDLWKLAIGSSETDWEEAGWDYFGKRRFSEALYCFEKANLPNEASIAKAYHLREVARSQPETSSHYSKPFLAAAQQFDICTSLVEAGTARIAYFQAAGECFGKGGEHIKAANSYMHSSDFASAAQQYAFGGAFYQAIEIIDRYEAHISSDIKECVTRDARIHFINKDKLNDAISLNLFKSYDEVIKFMEENDLDTALLSLLIQLKRYMDAAEHHVKKGRHLDAIRLFMREETKPRAEQRAAECITESLWQHLSFGKAKHDRTTLQTVQELLNTAQILQRRQQDLFKDEEISMFQAIVSNNINQLVAIGRYSKEDHITLFCLDTVFADLSKLQYMDGPELAETLHILLIYANLLQEVATREDLHKSPTFQRLFDFFVANNSVLVKKNTFLHRACPTDRRATHINIMFHVDDTSISLSLKHFQRLCRTALFARLLDRVSTISTACHRSRAVAPCLQFVGNRCSHNHTNPAAYHSRINLHLQQILLVNTLSDLFDDSVLVQKLRVLWITNLYGALNPPHAALGNISQLTMASIPLANKGFKVAAQWLPKTLDASTASFTYMACIISSLSHVIARADLDIDDVPQFHLDKWLGEEDQDDFYHDLVCFLDDEGSNSLVCGMNVIRQILVENLDFGLDILCDFVEHISASSIVHYLLSEKYTLHSLVLPCGSLITALKRSVSTARDTSSLEEFSQWMMDLLIRIHFKVGPEHLLYAGKSIQCDERTKTIFIARIFNALCLLVYNLPHVDKTVHIGHAFEKIFQSQEIQQLISAVAVEYATQRFESLRYLRPFPTSQQHGDTVRLDDLTCWEGTSRIAPATRLIRYQSIEDLVTELALVDRKQHTEAFFGI